MRRGLIAFVSIVGIAAALVTAMILIQFPVHVTGFRPWHGVAALMLLTVVAEGLGVRIAAGQAVFSVSLIPIVATVPLFGPSVAVASTALSQAIARTVLQKQPRLKAVFNVSQFSLAVGLGAVVYHFLNGPVFYGAELYGTEVYGNLYEGAVSLEFLEAQAETVEVEAFPILGTLPPLAGLIVTYFLANVLLVSTVIAIDTGKSLMDILRQLAPVAFANDLASSSFSLFVVFAFAQLGVGGILVVLLPLFFVHHAYGVQHKLEKQNREILEFTIRTIEAKDPYTSGHSMRVASLSRELAEVLGLSSNKAQEVETAALLHDIGKIDFAYSELIGSAGQLSDVDREILRSHPDRGARLLASLSNLSDDVLKAVRHHHEHYDGNGYPDGLSGTSIPLAARIIMVVDTVDAMLSNRPYRSALSVEEVATELRRFSGRQFDPAVLGRFLESGMLERAARRAEMDRTPLPLAAIRPREDVLRSYRH
jgi:putative nucleotidyltransferase with HDIG domain